MLENINKLLVPEVKATRAYEKKENDKQDPARRENAKRMTTELTQMIRFAGSYGAPETTFLRKQRKVLPLIQRGNRMVADQHFGAILNEMLQYVTTKPR